MPKLPRPESPTTGSLVWRLSTRWRAGVDRALAPLGLTHAQYALLASLYGLTLAGESPSQRALADYASLEPIYVSKLARALERAGLVVRTVNPADPRAVQLTLTDHGTKVVVEAIAIVRRLQAEMTAPIGGPGSRQTRDLNHMLQTLLGDFDD